MLGQKPPKDQLKDRHEHEDASVQMGCSEGESMFWRPTGPRHHDHGRPGVEDQYATQQPSRLLRVRLRPLRGLGCMRFPVVSYVESSAMDDPRPARLVKL